MKEFSEQTELNGRRVINSPTNLNATLKRNLGHANVVNPGPFYFGAVRPRYNTASSLVLRPLIEIFVDVRYEYRLNAEGNPVMSERVPARLEFAGHANLGHRVLAASIADARRYRERVGRVEPVHQAGRYAKFSAIGCHIGGVAGAPRLAGHRRVGQRGHCRNALTAVLAIGGGQIEQRAHPSLQTIELALEPVELRL